MATITPSIDKNQGRGDGSVVIATWSAMNGANNVGAAIDVASYEALSAQVNNTFNTGAIVMEGSNDGTNFVNMTDPNNANVVFTAAGLKNIVTAPRYVRPNVVNNGAATNLDVTLVMRRRHDLTR